MTENLNMDLINDGNKAYMDDENIDYMSDESIIYMGDENTAYMSAENIAQMRNPISQGIERIIIGIALSCITINFLALNYILPTIGAILLMLGFRELREENTWLKTAYLCSIIYTILTLSQLIINATVYSEYLKGDAGHYLLLGLCAIKLIILFSFWMSCNKIQQRAKIKEKSFAAGALFIWYSLLMLMAVINIKGFIAGIFMVISFIVIIKYLANFSENIKDSGYLVEAAPVKLSDGKIVQAIVGIIVIGAACGFLFCSDYNMNWRPEDDTEAVEEEIFTRLLELGYPEKQLKDLSPQEFELLKAADCIVTKTEDIALNNGVQKAEHESGTVYYTTEYPFKELKFTHVAVRVAGDGSNGEIWRVIHHFSVEDELKTKGTANIKIFPIESIEGWKGTENLSGRLLCTEKGKALTEDFISIEKQSYPYNDFFGNNCLTNSCICDFSLPPQATDRRGYVAYSSEQIENGFMLNSWIEYTHQTSLLQYPVKTAGMYAKEGMHIKEYPFITGQGQIQFYVKDGAPHN